jgi:carbon-monoxide dehydrogenase small subunit
MMLAFFGASPLTSGVVEVALARLLARGEPDDVGWSPLSKKGMDLSAAVPRPSAGWDAAMLAIRLSVNGRAYALSVAPDASLLSVIRNQIGLLGTKENCLEAECGVCTVLVDGRAVNSCIMLAALCEGAEITTIEGLGGADPLQEAFLRRGAVQCGFCIPGMIFTARSFLDGCAAMPTREEVREGLCGTLCRCTGYSSIIDAVIDVAAERFGGDPCS